MSSTITALNASNHSEIAIKDFEHNNLFFALATELDLDRQDSIMIGADNLRYLLEEVNEDKYYAYSVEEQDFIQELLAKMGECEEDVILSVYR